MNDIRISRKSDTTKQKRIGDKKLKLIEAKKAKEFASTFFGDPVLKMAINAAVDNAPGFDLVRCKICKWYDEECSYCQFWHGVRHEEHFCGEGEKKK